MRRVSSISPAGHWTAPAIDRVILDADDRNRRRIVLTGEKGTQVLLDFAKPVTLRDGDGLVLEDGSVVQVCGQPEQLIEITPPSPQDFVRLAWHLGNRHTDVQIVGQRIRIRRDHVLEEMLERSRRHAFAAGCAVRSRRRCGARYAQSRPRACPSPWPPSS